MQDAAAKLSLTPSLATSGFAQMSPIGCEMTELGAEVERRKLCCLLSRERNQNTDRCDCIGSETECLSPEEHMLQTRRTSRDAMAILLRIHQQLHDRLPVSLGQL